MSIEEAEGIRGKWIYNPSCGKLEPINKPSRPYVTAVHQDTMEPLKHPFTGEVFDSKSAFRRVTKANGGVEVGDKDSAWDRIGEIQAIKAEGFKEDFEEVKHWYNEYLKGNKDYINANVPPELRDCEQVDNAEDFTKGI